MDFFSAHLYMSYSMQIINKINTCFIIYININWFSSLFISSALRECTYINQYELICSQVFSSLPNSLSLTVSRNLEEKIDEVCWLVCKKNYLSREPRILSDECVYKLFRIFCLLGEWIPENEETFQVSSKR